ncbi:MAG: hypothetical protein M1600_08710, partial [Firmicutes bacterium]|nr:hypothetical protein [Bacillota bacterium]
TPERSDSRPASSPFGLLGGEPGNHVLARWGESHPRADESCEVCGLRTESKKAERNYCRFFNQVAVKIWGKPRAIADDGDTQQA